MRAAGEFFGKFCRHVNADDFSALTGLFEYPVTIAYVDPMAVCNSPPEIEELMALQAREYRKAGVADVLVKVVSDVRNDSGTHFVDVVWSFKDSNDAQMFAYPACYVLREDKDGALKTVMFASHNTEECRAYLEKSRLGEPIGVALN